MISIPGMVYLAMGAVAARILLDGTRTEGYRAMDWLNLGFNTARIVMLWPLVLFADRLEEWLKREPAAAPMAETAQLAESLFEGWQPEHVLPIPTTGRAEAGD